MISRRALLSVAVAFGIGAATNLQAQTYPDKPIKLVVPFPPGGPIDTMARLVAQGMSSNLGQQVVVENRPGAGSTIGSKAVASADPDGYTLLFGSSGSLGVAPALYANLGLDPLKSFAPIASVSLLPHVMVVPASVPAKTVQEFVAYAKANPGKLNFGAGLGAPPHLLGVLFKNKAGIDVTYVPYKGAAPAVTDMLGGQTHFAIDGMLILMPQHQSGETSRACRRPPAALARAARGADHDGKRLPGFHHRRLDRGGRPGRHAAAAHRAAQRRGERRALEPGDGNRHGALQLDHQNRDAGGIRGLHCVGSAALGGDG